MDSGKVEKTMSPTMIQAEDAKGNPFLNSITTSPNGSILCASSSDKVVHLIDSSTGHSMYQGFGHGDLITDVAFINQANHVASASADGCIFIWKLAEVIKRKVEPSSMVLCSRPNSVSPEHTPIAQSPASVFRFDEATLPAWARTEPGEQVKVIVPPTQGRWAEVFYVDVAG
jgi:WD40 repeat protein